MVYSCSRAAHGFRASLKQGCHVLTSFGLRKWRLHLADDCGSAVAEFSLLAIPMCFATIAATNYCLNVYFDTLLRATAISVTRFAGLADTTIAQARQRTRLMCEEQFEQVNAKCHLWFEAAPATRAHLRVTYQPLSLLFVQPREVIVYVSSGLEIEK